MSDLISREALLEAIKDVEVAWYLDGNYTTYDDTTIMDIIEDQPTVEAVPVVHGEWESGMGRFFPVNICSVCNCSTVLGKTNFCPNCGADMRKKV